MAFGVELPEESALREAAEARLQERAAPPTKGWPLGIGTLALLYELASQPDKASDALKLLHELQVHQVELDLLYAEILEREAALDQDLRHYRSAFECSPVACCLVSDAGVIEEANVACAVLLDRNSDALPGQSLARFLTAPSQTAFGDLLQKLRDGEPVALCDVELTVGRRAGTALSAHGGAGADDGSPYIIIMS